MGNPSALIVFPRFSAVADQSYNFPAGIDWTKGKGHLMAAMVIRRHDHSQKLEHSDLKLGLL